MIYQKIKKILPNISDEKALYLENKILNEIADKIVELDVYLNQDGKALLKVKTERKSKTFTV